MKAYHVSVPSTGRSGLQRGVDVFPALMDTGFSTLYGSKWVATMGLACPAVTAAGFSTLYGSKWVATEPVLQVTVAAQIVSVPSTGRSGLQRQHTCRQRSLGSCFSTLYGSKWVATYAVPVQGGQGGKVSVPSTGRSGLQQQTHSTSW